jgi:hypothetical protein
VNSLLTKIDYNTNENFILYKCSTYVLLRFTHMGATTEPKEMSYTKEEMSYMEVEPSPCLLAKHSSSKSHMHHTFGFTFHDLYGRKDIVVLTSHKGVMNILVETVTKAECHARLS